MYIKKLEIINFKNYNDANISLSSKINAFVGNNGVGKTNIIDAIYYLSFTKSYFHQTDLLNIKFDTDFFLLKGKYEINNEEINISCGVKKEKKKVLKKNNKEYKKLSEHIGLIPLVMISPGDYTLITGSGDERRKLVDGVISQYDRGYLEVLLKYNKAVQQRNKLLKQFTEFNNFDSDLLSVYDEQLIENGTIIFKKRGAFIKLLTPVFQKYYNHISSGKEVVEIKYKSELLEKSFADILKNNITKDRAVTYTTSGIHKDDIDFNLGTHSIKKIGSQGQQKTYLIALKLAQFDFIREKSNTKPILLFDDVFDKLDSIRVEQIIKLVINNNFGQIFMTDANKFRIERILSTISEDFKVFEIKNNEANEI